MYNLYIDEKGTQETFNMNSNSKNISYGSDNMKVYVGAVILIPVKKENIIHHEFLQLEEAFRENSQKNKDEELKTKEYIKRSNFKYGFASLNKKNITMVNNILKLTKKNDIKISTFAINKLSSIFKYRFRNYIYKLSELNIASAHLFFYSIVKYLQLEAPPEIIQMFFDPHKKNKEIIYKIRKHLNQIINQNRNIKRMKAQIANYKELNYIIRKMNQENIKEISYPTGSYKFEWKKVTQNLDLWITELENYNNIKNEEINIFLDNGIPTHPFQELNFKSIQNNVDSKSSVGIRIADFFAVIVGNYITLLKEALKNQNKYENNHLEQNWFKFNKAQFDAIIELNSLLNDGFTYSINLDTYFDDMYIFIEYLKYISSYKTYDNFSSSNHKNHGVEFTKKLVESGEKRFEQATLDEMMAISTFGSLETSINLGIKREL